LDWELGQRHPCFLTFIFTESGGWSTILRMESLLLMFLRTRVAYGITTDHVPPYGIATDHGLPSLSELSEKEAVDEA
jgi:hypothetical protein